MRVILFVIQKEFLQIFRNRAMLPIIFAMPIIQLVVLSNAATFEVRDVPMSVVDDDRSTTSRLLIARMEASGYFSVALRADAANEADESMLRNESGMILHIPADMEASLRSSGRASVQMIFDAKDGAAAGIAQAYAVTILGTLGIDLENQWFPSESPATVIDIVPSHWYNPDLDYITFMVPGILVLLVTMIGTFLSSMNVVREKEIGTIEQLNVTPLRKVEFIVGKLFPLWVIALFELAFGLVIARVLFSVPMLGSITLVFGLAAVYLLVMLGLGLWISTVTETQQQAMFLAWFVMVIFILMSGLFTPIDSMPQWAQHLTKLNPVAYFITIMRRVLLKGAGFAAVQMEFWALVAYAGVVLTLAVRQYRKVTA